MADSIAGSKRRFSNHYFPFRRLYNANYPQLDIALRESDPANNPARALAQTLLSIAVDATALNKAQFPERRMRPYDSFRQLFRTGNFAIRLAFSEAVEGGVAKDHEIYLSAYSGIITDDARRGQRSRNFTLGVTASGVPARHLTFRPNPSPGGRDEPEFVADTILTGLEVPVNAASRGMPEFEGMLGDAQGAMLQSLEALKSGLAAGPLAVRVAISNSPVMPFLERAPFIRDVVLAPDAPPVLASPSLNG